MRVIVAAHMNNMGALIRRVLMRERVMLEMVTALDRDFQCFTGAEQGAAWQDLNLHRHDLAALEFQTALMFEIGLQSG